MTQLINDYKSKQEPELVRQFLVDMNDLTNQGVSPQDIQTQLSSKYPQLKGKFQDILNAVHLAMQGGDETKISESAPLLLGSTVTKIYQNFSPNNQEQDGGESRSIPLGLKIGAGVAGYKVLRNALPPLDYKIQDKVNKIRGFVSNINTDVNQGNKKVRDFIKLVGSMGEDAVDIAQNKGFKGIYDYIKEVGQEAYKEKSAIINKYKDVIIPAEDVGQDLLDLIGGKKLANTKKELSKIFNNIKDNFFQQDGKRYISLPDAEKLKEEVYQEADNYDQKVGADAADIKSKEGYKTLGKSLKNAIEKHTNGEIKAPNDVYAMTKNVDSGIGKLVNKAGTQDVFTRGRNIGETIKRGAVQIPGVREYVVPGLSSMAKEEKELPKLVDYIQRWGNKMLSKVEGKAPEIKKVATKFSETGLGKGLSKAGKVIKPIGGVMAGLGVLSTIPGATEGVSAAEGTDNVPSAIKAQKPKYGSSIISQGQEGVNPENKIFKTNGGTSPAEFLSPEIGLAGLGIGALSELEKTIRGVKEPKTKSKLQKKGEQTPGVGNIAPLYSQR